MSRHKSKTTKSQGGGDRINKIADLIHRAIAKLLSEEFKDPRIGMVTISNVEVSRDLAHAKVYFTVFEEDKVNDTATILNGAAGFFRANLAHALNLRVVPKLRFIFDDSVLKGSRISALLSKALGDDQDQNT